MDLDEFYLVEMASIRFAKLSIGSCYLIVRPNDRGLIPHFHVHLKSDGQNFTRDITIHLDIPDYFIHGNHDGMLNSGDRKKLAEFIGKPYDEEITNWRYLVATWNHDHPESRVQGAMPDYRKLPHRY